MKRRRTIPLTPHETERYDRLLKATEHVAPYNTFGTKRSELKYWDSLRVIRDYVKGYPPPMEAVKRLATDAYGRHTPTFKPRT